MTKTILFHRDYQRLRGGVIKVWDYFQHINATPGFEAKIGFAPGAADRKENPWIEAGITPLEDWRTIWPDAFFLGAMDWNAWRNHPASRDGNTPILSFIQHPNVVPKSTNPVDLLNPAIHIAVSEAIADLGRELGVLRDPILVIPCGLDIRAIPAPGTVAKTADVVIAGLKNPDLARSLQQRLAAAPDLSVDLLDHQLPRDQYLARIAAARVAIFLPMARETFYLAALEGMAAGTITICPEVGGNRGYLLDGQNSLNPTYDETALLAAAQQALAMAPSQIEAMQRLGVETAGRFSLAAERAAFQDVLANLDDLWRQARASAVPGTPRRSGSAPSVSSAEQSRVKHVETALITGLPRSGTTLTCELLNLLPDTIALDEPGLSQVFRAARHDGRQRLGDALSEFVRQQRHSILEEKRATSTTVDGRIGGNHFGNNRNASGVRTDVAVVGTVLITKPLSPDFLLAIKSPMPVSANLRMCAAVFPTFAIVRNPLATLASWSSVEFEFHLQYADRVARKNPALARRLARAADTIDRQIALLAWFFEQYLTLLPKRQIIRYEDLVATHGRALSVITPAAATLDQPLTNYNRNPLYDAETMRVIGQRLLTTDGPYWSLYSRDDVRELVDGPVHERT